MGDTEEESRRQYHITAEFLQRLVAVTSNRNEQAELLDWVASYEELARQEGSRQLERAAA